MLINMVLPGAVEEPIYLDDNVMALYHFDDELKDTAERTAMTSLKNVTSYTAGKFEKGLSMAGDGTTGWQISNISFGTGDFTIDFWFYGTAMPTAFAKLFESTLYSVAGGIMAEVTPNTTTIHVRQCGPDYTSHQLSFSYSLNTWTHFAIVKKSGVITVYQNGVSVGSFTATNNLTATTMKIGASADTANNVSAPGVMDELRISNIARWTANFTPENEPYEGIAKPITDGGGEIEYTGNYTDNRVNGKGSVRLNSSGMLTVPEKVTVTVYILAAGGGSAHRTSGPAAGGGGGGNQTVSVTLEPGIYEIIIGTGGAAATVSGSTMGTATGGDGGNTTAFGVTSTGGKGGVCTMSNITPGAGGTPGGNAGEWSSYNYASGGAPNGGSVDTAIAQPGGDGYVELTFI